MIQFSWTQLAPDKFRIEIKTPTVRIGTLHRLTAAIYVQGLDIESGDVYTIEEAGEFFSQDSFVIRVAEASKSSGGLTEATTRLGTLMETLLRGDSDPDDLLKQNKVQPPDTIKFFENPPEILFQDIPARKRTQFYIETSGRRGLLYHLTRILYRENINILQATIRTRPNGMAEDTFYLQYEDGPLGQDISKKLEALITGKTRENAGK